MRVSSNRFVFGFLVIAFSSVFGQVFGQVDLTIEGGGNNATFGGLGMMVDDAAAIALDPVLDGTFKFDLTVTTTSDILLVDAQFDQTPGMNVPGGWYNDTANGNDVNPPPLLFIHFTPQMYFDTWVTTPGQSARAGANTLDGPPGMNMVTHSDSTDEGPQTDFTFARITLIPDEQGNASLVFRGTLQTQADPRPVFDDFEYRLSIGVPEPASMGLVVTALLGSLSIIRRRRNG